MRSLSAASQRASDRIAEALARSLARPLSESDNNNETTVCVELEQRAHCNEWRARKWSSATHCIDASSIGRRI